MAIEFNCPYCTSTIRVKDAAAGKRGRCPRCSEQLLVPTVQSFEPTSAPPPAANPTTTQPTAAAAVPAAPVMEPTAPVPAPAVQPVVAGDFPNVPVISTAPGSPTQNRAASRTRRRRKSSDTLAMGILGVCFAAITGLAGYLWWSSQPVSLNGNLPGELVASSNIKPVKVSADSISGDTRDSVLAALREMPFSMKSSLLVTEFRATETDIEVRLLPTTTTSIVRVSPQADESLATWLSENSSRVVGERQAAVSKATEKFFADYADSKANGTSLRDETPYYRNHLALGAMNVGLGYVVEAATAKQVCPCVFEDPAGNLYFAVPRDTDNFTVRGRTMPDGRKLFPGTFAVSCGAVPEDIELVEPTAPETKPSEPAGSESKATETKGMGSETKDGGAEFEEESGMKPKPKDAPMGADFEMESGSGTKPSDMGSEMGSGTADKPMSNEPAGSGSRE